MSRLHLVMPMAGAGSRFTESGFTVPKPLIPLHGKPFFWWAAMSVMDYAADVRFVVLKEHAENFGIIGAIRGYFPDAGITVIPEVLPGPVFTCLEGAKDISDDMPVIFNDCDHMFTCPELAQAGDYDGALLTFTSTDPRFSYVMYDAGGRVTGTIEKQAVSTSAICGAYIFRSAGLFRDLAAEYVSNCPYNECFMSGLYNIMCRKGLTVGVFSAERHIDFGTPEGYKLALNSELFAEA